MAYQRELDTALHAVRKAAALCRRVQAALKDYEAMAKEDRSPVTVADLGSQAVISMELAQAFPNDPIVGEEDTAIWNRHAGIGPLLQALVSEVSGPVSEEHIREAIDRSSSRHQPAASRFWTLDPIDGTKGFLRGEQYAIALALIDQGRVALGVLGCPNLPPAAGGENGCLTWAVAGEGSRLQPLTGARPETVLTVDGLTDPGRARFCESVESAHAAHDVHGRISRLLGISAPPVRLDSQVKYVAVARGDASIYLRLPRQESYREKIWDHAAGAVIVQEAGGTVTDVFGRELDFTRGKRLEKNYGILVTNGRLHHRVVEAVARAT